MPFVSCQEGTIVEFEGKKSRVQAMCVEGTRAGFWICITHQQSFHLPGTAMNHMKEKGEHLVVWNCKFHGVEVP